MLRDALGQTYQKVIFLQALLVAIVVPIAWFFAGETAAMSALVGGAAVLTGSLAYAWLARESRVSAVSAGRVLARHLLAEVVKILVVLVVMAAALASGWFAAVWLIAAMGVALLGHLLALLIIR